MFGPAVRDEITSNILREASYPRALTVLMCLCIGIIPLTKIPLNARPIVATLEVLLGLQLYHGEEGGGDRWRVVGRGAVRVGVVVVFLGIAVVFPAFDSIMAFMGSALCFTICVTYVFFFSFFPPFLFLFSFFFLLFPSLCSLFFFSFPLFLLFSLFCFFFSLFLFDPLSNEGTLTGIPTNPTKTTPRLPLAFYLKLFGHELSTREKAFAFSVMVLSFCLSVVGTVWSFLPKSLIGAEPAAPEGW